ncbi:MAG: diguanylate cyclase [Actinophytocola sp.]|nr:diguanylate cyclase [Actinophytocola sp.]
MHRVDTQSSWATSEVDAFAPQAPLEIGTFGEAAQRPGDLVDLHESIANLLAAEGNWRLAYAHINAALRLARDAHFVSPLIPEQYRREVDELRKAHAAAVDASLRDALTATYNRRYLDQRLGDLSADRSSTGAGIAVALVDLDHFKLVNDTHGHLVGDSVLRQLVALLQNGLPNGSFCARYGGEEFVLVLPNVTARQAVVTLERARRRVDGHGWSAIAPELHITVSAGLVHLTAADLPRMGAECQLRRADDLLYAAKRAGRNAVAYRISGAIRIAGLDDNCR